MAQRERDCFLVRRIADLGIEKNIGGSCVRGIEAFQHRRFAERGSGDDYLYPRNYRRFADRGNGNIDFCYDSPPVYDEYEDAEWYLWIRSHDCAYDEKINEVSESDSQEEKTRHGKQDADTKANGGTTKLNNKGDDDLKKKNRPFMTQFFSPIFLKAFSITFFGEWGDKSQLATIGLAAAENPLGVVLGGILGQTLCQIAAVFGGKCLATQISERFIALFGRSKNLNDVPYDPGGCGSDSC